jgi:hypothetical protein
MQIEIEAIGVAARSLRRVGKASPVADEGTGGWHGLVSDVLENGSHRCVPLACFTAAEITNHPVSFATAAISPPPPATRATKNNEMGVFQTPRWACDHRFMPPLFRIAVPGDLNSRISQI